MNIRKLISICLITGILNINILPLTAQAAQHKKLIKSQVTEYRFDYVNMDWWKKFNDDKLDAYIIKAVENNQDLKIATLRVEEYNQLVKLQFSKELPSAMIGFAPNIAKMSGATNSDSLYSFPLLVNYEADIFLKNRDKTKSSKKQYESSILDEKAAYIAVASAVGATYFNIIKLDRLVDIQKEIISYRKQIYELMLKRNKEGITSTADVVKANKAYVASTNELIEIEKARTLLLNKFAVLIGESPNNIEDIQRIPYSEIKFTMDIPKEISSEIITQRPDYLRAEKQVEKAGLDVKIAKKELLPSFNILGLIFFNSNQFTKSLNWSSALAAFGGGMLFPIFSGGSKITNLKLSKNKYDQILQNYFKTNLTAIQEVNDSLSTLKLDNEKYVNNISQLNMEEEDYSFNKRKYEEGIISKLDLIQHKENLLTMGKIVSSNKMDCAIDYIGLYKAVGNKL